MEEELLNQKWQKLLGLIKRFKYVPFVEFVLVAGSMATGEIHEKSDFDLIVGVRSGRIFTARQFSAGIFELTGHRRKGADHKENTKNKICLNHYVTFESYCLAPPYDEYWIYLYQNLVPVYGNKKSIENFFNTNKWAGKMEIDYGRWQGEDRSFWKRFGEFVLKSKPGSFIEKIFKKYQTQRVEKGLEKAKGYKPRVKYNDTELKFHMDTRRIEEWLKNNKNTG